MVKGKLFEKARENALYKVCEGCGEKKSIDDFKKTNKYCNNCPHVQEIREEYKKNYLENNNIATTSEIEDIDLDKFFKDL
jgi:transcription initiation factor TFIIIB Brf1 subunit/transcription initiation factor TFIIB